ncbi:hypothetical protein T492DRAFT_961852, partial [Pavlovales sp. CCMP2436]
MRPALDGHALHAATRVLLAFAQKEAAAAYGVQQPQVSRWVTKLRELQVAVPSVYLGALVLQDALNVLPAVVLPAVAPFLSEREKKHAKEAQKSKKEVAKRLEKTMAKIMANGGRCEPKKVKVKATEEEMYKAKKINKEHNTTARKEQRKNTVVHTRELANQKDRCKQTNSAQLGATYLDILAAALALAIVLYEDQSRLADAKPLYRRVLKGREEQLGARHTDTITIVIALAEVIKGPGRLTEAEQLYWRALAGREEQPSASDAATLIYREQTFLDVLCLAGLLEAQGGQGRLVEAETLYLCVLNERETLLGASHLGTLRVAQYLAKMLNKLDKRDEAEPLYRRAIPWLETELGENHTSTLESVHILAELLGKQGMEARDEALSLSRRALAGLASSLGDTAEEIKDAAESRR